MLERRPELFQTVLVNDDLASTVALLRAAVAPAIAACRGRCRLSTAAAAAP